LFINEKNLIHGKFEWQEGEGYGGFSMVILRLEWFMSILKPRRFIIKPGPSVKNIWNFRIGMKLNMKIVSYLNFVNDFL